MPRMLWTDDAELPGEGELSAVHAEALLRRRANGLRALEKAEAAEDAVAAAKARKQVQEAQLLIQRYRLE